MLKICHMTSAHPRYDIRIFHKECISLAKHGYEIYLLVNDTKSDEKKDGVQIVSSNFVPKGRIQRMIKSRKYLYQKAVEINADIYHFHDPELLGIGYKLKKAGKKVVFDCHEFYSNQIIYEKEYIPKILRRIISFLYSSYETRVVKALDAVIIPTTFSGVNIFENRAKRTVYINNVPKLEEFYEQYKEAEKQSDVNRGFSVCHIGTLSHVRGISYLIQAAYKSQVKLILGGTFISTDFEKQIKDMEEYGEVDYRGYIGRDEVLNVYKESNIGICTILHIGQNDMLDNFATKVYEYMSMGLPVIITDYPYARTIMKEHKFGILVNPEDSNEISKTINFLKEHPDIASEMGKNGRKLIKEKYNWSIEEKKLFDLYDIIK